MNRLTAEAAQVIIFHAGTKLNETSMQDADFCESLAPRLMNRAMKMRKRNCVPTNRFVDEFYDGASAPEIRPRPKRHSPPRPLVQAALYLDNIVDEPLPEAAAPPPPKSIAEALRLPPAPMLPAQAALSALRVPNSLMQPKPVMPEAPLLPPVPIEAQKPVAKQCRRASAPAPKRAECAMAVDAAPVAPVAPVILPPPRSSLTCVDDIIVPDTTYETRVALGAVIGDRFEKLPDSMVHELIRWVGKQDRIGTTSEGEITLDLALFSHAEFVDFVQYINKLWRRHLSSTRA
jgi:hypothetical protein